MDELTNSSVEGVVQIMLRHVQSVAAGLTVPLMTPRVFRVARSDAAGAFVVTGDGWVRIDIDPQFAEHAASAKSILAHELCHYVLEANGIRSPSVDQNERFTDAAIFVFGLGNVFLAGYTSDSDVRYRGGHRLGYLSDEEYARLNHVTGAARLGLHLQGPKTVELPTEGSVSLARFKNAIPDAATRKRLFSRARDRNPALSDQEVIEKVLEEYFRDRR